MNGTQQQQGGFWDGLSLMGVLSTVSAWDIGRREAESATIPVQAAPEVNVPANNAGLTASDFMGGVDTERLVKIGVGVAVTVVAAVVVFKLAKKVF